MKTILLKAKITKASRKKDGSVSLAVSTVGEITPEELLEIDKSLGMAGNMAFGPNPADISNIPDEVVEDGSKSSSQRLRSVIFIMYEQSEKRTSMTFDEYYKRVMEVFINNIKSRLEPKEPAF